MALGVAFRAFFAALGNRKVSDQIRSVLDQTSAPAALPSTGPEPTLPAKLPPVSPLPAQSKRSEAITMLATLQREARLLDLVKENLSAYSDAQVGAAARPCLTQCASTLDRIFGLSAIVPDADGKTIDVPQNAAPSRYTWIGEGSGSSGKLIHHGWEASRVDLPQWTGTDADARVIAPVQVQRS